MAGATKRQTGPGRPNSSCGRVMYVSNQPCTRASAVALTRAGSPAGGGPFAPCLAPSSVAEVRSGTSRGQAFVEVAR